ncbi:hypothetical protein CYJ48_11870 [Corynebacterium riegelii]|nr:hypothetical protein CYJ48_11870 [Corynebacterium riegelii]
MNGKHGRALPASVSEGLTHKRVKWQKSNWPERFNPFNWEWEEALNPIVGERLLKKEWKDRRLFTA